METRRRFRHAPHLLRLGAFVFVVSLVALGASVRAARAQVHDGMRALARQLMPYAEQGVMETPRRVTLNGETLYLAVGSTRDSVRAVLDFYEQRCARRGPRITEELTRSVQGSPTHGQLPMSELWATPGRRAATFETLRASDDESGYVACIDVGERRPGVQGLLQKVRAVVDTGDLGQLGGMRYAYVTRSTRGARIITVATEGRFNILRMFPETGDAPGSDVAGLPRFPRMRRLLSAREDGTDYGLGVYSVRAPQGRVRDFYRSSMGAEGWSPMTLPPGRTFSPEVERHRNDWLAFSRGNTMLMLVFEEHQGTTSMMTLAGM